jgi:hypothetical protein
MRSAVCVCHAVCVTMCVSVCLCVCVYVYVCVCVCVLLLLLLLLYIIYYIIYNPPPRTVRSHARVGKNSLGGRATASFHGHPRFLTARVEGVSR